MEQIATDLTGLSFRDQLWLNTFPLDCNLVFDYFALSPFYDRSCNNEQLRMRSIHPLDMPQLRKMTGIEYVLHEAQEPHRFIIWKQRRESPEKSAPVSAFYVLDGSVYQAPLVYNVIGSRVVRALHHIKNAFSQVATKLEKIGYEDEDGELDAKSEVGTDKVVDVKEVMRIDQILGNVLRKLPPAPAPPPIPPPPGSVAEQQQAETNHIQEANKKPDLSGQPPPPKKLKT